MSILRIKVNQKEYELACSNGCAYGLVDGNSNLYAYVELGLEGEYNPQKDREWLEERRFFRNCEVFFALKQENLDQGIYENKTYKGNVVLYR